MKTEEFLKIKKIIEDLQVTGTFDIINLDADLNKARVAWTVEIEPNNALSAGKQRKIIVCEQVVNFHYAPDFTDSPPWTIHKSAVEQLNTEGDLGSDELLGFDRDKCGNDFWPQQMPFYRLIFDCWGLRASVLCRKLHIDEIPEVKSR